MDEKNEERQEDVELLLDRQRPGVEQGEGRRRRHEIAGAAGEIEIGDGEGRGQERAGVAHELVRQHVDIGQDGDRQHHDGQRRQDAPDPPLVEGDERESPGRDLVDDHRADEIARDDEEDVHPDEAAAKQRPLRMERDHRCHGDGAQAVDVLPIGANHVLLAAIPGPSVNATPGCLSSHARPPAGEGGGARRPRRRRDVARPEVLRPRSV